MSEGVVYGRHGETRGALLSSSATSAASWNWIWPNVGPTPVSQGLDSEMFDRADYPYSETFVREAIQNTLDARLNSQEPAIIAFRFHRAALGARKAFLDPAIEFRKKAHLHPVEEWQAGSIDWLTIEDFNAKGLGGNLDSRMSDFWNYWLNFGMSNKDGSGRGGRGIGRVTFLIASRMQTVLGLTRRSSDGRTVGCGMCVLRAFEDGNKFRATHAYLAASEKESIYRTHDEPSFHRGLEQAFELTGYEGAKYKSGLALIIPYPHPELDADGILASAIEHFAPAILNKSLVVQVDDQRLDDSNISAVAHTVAPRIRAEAIRDVDRYLSLIERGLSNDLVDVAISDVRSGLAAERGTSLGRTLQAAAERGEMVGMRITIPLERSGRATTVSLKAVVAKTPAGQLPIDRLYREGMSLPDVKTKNPGELDAVIMVDDNALATYLNFCEGKAHLDLLESKETKAKLEDNGYSTNFRVKRFVKGLPVDLRSLLTPDIVEPDASVFDSFFSVPDDTPGRVRGGGRPLGPDNPLPPPPPPRISPLVVDVLDDGFRVRANPKFTSWPINASINIAYADGTRRPGWSEFDFRPSDLATSQSDCDVTWTKNKLQALNCGPSCNIEVTGFDSKRELDTHIRFWKNA